MLSVQSVAKSGVVCRCTYACGIEYAYVIENVELLPGYFQNNLHTELLPGYFQNNLHFIVAIEYTIHTSVQREIVCILFV